MTRRSDESLISVSLRCWWSRRRLRTKIFLPFAALIALALLAALGVTQYIVRRQAEHSVRAQLVVTGQVFRGRLEDQARALTGNVRLLASDFALKRAIATNDPATLVSVAENYQLRVGVDIM